MKKKPLKPLRPRSTAGAKLDPGRPDGLSGSTEIQFTGDAFGEGEADGGGFLERPLTEDDDTGSEG